MKNSFLATTAVLALIAGTTLASAQNQNTKQPFPEAQAPAGQQPDSSQGLGTGSSAGDKAQPNLPGATTGSGTPPAMQGVPSQERGVVRPSESNRQRPGDSAN